MHCQRAHLVVLAFLATLPWAGCRWGQGSDFASCGSSVACYEEAAAEIEYPAVSECTDGACCEELCACAPWTISADQVPEYWDLRLEEVVQIALANSRVLHDLGGAVVRSPSTTRTAWDAAIQETDPRQGIDAALSEFDAQFTTSLFFDKNDRALNNEFFGGGTRMLVQDLGTWESEISKRAATGTEFSIRHLIEYDANNAPGNAVPSAYDMWVEGEFRHPLLQGGGGEFNRIAGPTDTPGVYNGVLIARINTDVQLADFEIAVRDLVSNLENAYWDLYFAYRDLDAKIAARDGALETWRKIYALYESGRRGGEAEKEAQAREQFFRFQEEVQNALSGRLVDGTRTGNGSSGGTFRATGGLHVAERRLRLLMGLAPSDCKLIRPSDEPAVAQIAFDWCEISHEATVRRSELRRQKWQIRRRELELIASKNHLLPRLDAVGRYRWRGIGGDLLTTDPGAIPPFDSAAYDTLLSGNYQEWQLGVELSVPIGYRRAHTGVRNAELRLARERAILCDQQREVVHEVAGAVAELDRAYEVSQTSYNRLIAARQQLEAVEALHEAEVDAPLDLLLDAQRRLAEAESQYFRTVAEHAVAAKNVHFSKGTLLDYDGVYLAEGAWPGKAHHDAQERDRRRLQPRPLNYASSLAPIVSEGTYPQQGGAGGLVEPLYQESSPSDAGRPGPVEQMPAIPFDNGLETDPQVPTDAAPQPSVEQSTEVSPRRLPMPGSSRPPINFATTAAAVSPVYGSRTQRVLKPVVGRSDAMPPIELGDSR